MSVSEHMVFFREERKLYKNNEYNPNKNHEIFLRLLKELGPGYRVPTYVSEVIIYKNRITIKCEAFFPVKLTTKDGFSYDYIEIDQQSYDIYLLEHIIMLNKVLSGDINSNSALFHLATGKDPSTNFDELHDQVWQTAVFSSAHQVGAFLARDIGSFGFEYIIHEPIRLAGKLITNAVNDYINCHSDLIERRADTQMPISQDFQ